jgi:transcriptional regulator with XRE-family HTH domain
MRPEPRPNYAARMRALRYILGKDNKPLSGEEFARMVGMKSGTLRAIESGLRNLSAADEEQIADQLGAMWDEEKKGWYCVIAPHTPYTPDIQRLYQRGRVNGFSGRIPRGGDFQKILDVMWEHFPPREFFLTLIEIQRRILGAAKRSGVPPEVMEELIGLLPFDVPSLKAWDLQEGKKTSSYQRPAAKETTLLPEGGKSAQNSAAASDVTTPK